MRYDDATPPDARRRRAHNGGGTLRWKEATRRWELRFQIRGVRVSEYFSESAYGNRKRAFDAALRQQRILAGKAAAGLLVLTRDTSIEDFAERFLQRQTHLEETTRKEYRARLAHLLRLLPGARLKTLDDGDAVARVFTALREEGYSAKTISHVHHVTGLLIDAAVRQGFLRDNVIRREKIRRPTIAPRDYRLFTAAEVYAMLDDEESRGGPMEALVALMGLSALRPGEAISLRWDDLAGEWLQIHQSGRRSTTKTRSGVRRIRLTERVLVALERWRRDGAAPGPEAFAGVTVKWVDKQFHRLQGRLGIEPPGRPYDLRHTAITHAIAYAQSTPGVSIADVARWAGHSRNSTTMDTYCHVLDGSPGLADVMATAYRSELDRAALGAVSEKGSGDTVVATIG